LFAADACINRKGMVLAAAQEDVDEAQQSLAKLSRLKFEIACFGHGPPVMTEADRFFRKRWL
jgi:glyoxylase-like metal-dependent hydrolase (beta-lactamase superfamily II)